MQINPFALAVTLFGFEIQETDRIPLLGFEKLFVNFALSSLVRGAYRFDEITLVLPFASVRIMQNGQLNLVELAKAFGGTTAADQAGTPAQAESEKKPE